MRNKLFSALLLSIILSINAVSYANPIVDAEDKIAVEAVADIGEGFRADNGFVNKPKDFEVTTTKDAVVISGTGKENDRVLISLYKREKDSYVPMGESIEIKIGQLGVFTKEISLKEMNKKAPREAVVSKETFIILELKRGENSLWDYRLVRFADEKDVKKSLQNVRSNALVLK